MEMMARHYNQDPFIARAPQCQEAAVHLRDLRLVDLKEVPDPEYAGDTVYEVTWADTAESLAYRWGQA